MRIVTPQVAQGLVQQGWKAADLHVHTSHSYDVQPVPEFDPDSIYTKAKMRNMHWVSFTDHDTMSAYDSFRAAELIRGVEIKILDKVNVGHSVHINVYTLSKQQFLELEYIANEEQDIYKFTAYCKKHKLPFAYNHPYWAEPWELCHHKGVERIAKLFPVIELNLGRVRAKNDLALELAMRYKKGIVANTDSHSGDVGHVYTIAKGKTFKEWWRNVEKGNAVVVRGDLTASYMISEVNRRVHAIFSPKLREHDLVKFRKYTTGVKFVDILTRFMFWARKFRIGRWIMKNFMLLLSYSHLPVVIYLRKENNHGKKLRKAIENSS